MVYAKKKCRHTYFRFFYSKIISHSQHFSGVVKVSIALPSHFQEVKSLFFALFYMNKYKFCSLVQWYSKKILQQNCKIRIKIIHIVHSFAHCQNYFLVVRYLYTESRSFFFWNCVEKNPEKSREKMCAEMCLLFTRFSQSRSLANRVL